MDQQRTRITDPLLGKMWKTKGARFNAHLRLIRKHSLSTWATTILAFYIFVASMVPLVYVNLSTGDAGRLIMVLTVTISVFLIIITLLENSKDYHREGDRMLKCALEISEVYNRFQALAPEAADAKRTAYNEEYSALLQKHELNHKDIDFLQFQMRNSRELQIGWGRYVVNCFRYASLWIAEYWLYVVLVVVPPLVAVLLRRQLVL